MSPADYTASEERRGVGGGGAVNMKRPYSKPAAAERTDASLPALEVLNSPYLHDQTRITKTKA